MQITLTLVIIIIIHIHVILNYNYNYRVEEDEGDDKGGSSGRESSIPGSGITAAQRSQRGVLGRLFYGIWRKLLLVMMKNGVTPTDG